MCSGAPQYFVKYELEPVALAANRKMIRFLFIWYIFKWSKMVSRTNWLLLNCQTFVIEQTKNTSHVGYLGFMMICARVINLHNWFFGGTGWTVSLCFQRYFAGGIQLAHFDMNDFFIHSDEFIERINKCWNFLDVKLLACHSNIWMLYPCPHAWCLCLQNVHMSCGFVELNLE